MRLETLTIRPAGASRRSGSIAWVTAITPKTLVSNTARTSSSLAALGVPNAAIPALLTRTSSRPNSRRIRAAAAAIESARVTSSAIATGIAGDPFRGGFAARGVACADQDGEAARRELARDRVTDTLVRASDQCDLVFVHALEIAMDEGVSLGDSWHAKLQRVAPRMHKPRARPRPKLMAWRLASTSSRSPSPASARCAGRATSSTSG